MARVSSQEGLKPAYAWHLMVFDDHDGVFRKRITWDLRDGHDSSHAFRGWVAGREYLFLYPNFRVPADLQSLSDLSAYEAYTCVTDGWGRLRPQPALIGMRRGPPDMVGARGRDDWTLVDGGAWCARGG